jgi:competence protein ComEA
MKNLSQRPPTPPTPPRGEIFDFDLSSPSPMNNLSSPNHSPKGWFIAIFAAAFCLIALGAYVQSKSKAPTPIGPFVDPTNTAPTLKVQVLGQVKTPGVYDLPGGARVQDAIDAAGGTLPDADLSGLNLAGWATDGSKIEVPQLGAIAPAVPVQNVPVASPTTGGLPVVTVPTGANSPVANNTPTTLPDAGIPRAALPAGGASVNGDVEYLKKNPLDLNQASAAQLEVLPGVGPKMAARIVEYRLKISRFGSVNELDNVEGIGEKRLTVLRELVVVK